MIALVRYEAALLLHSQRYLPPLLLLLAVFGILYGERQAPAPPELAVSAAALAVVACWLTIALVDVEDPVQRLITLSHARGRLKAVAGVVLTVLATALLLTVVSLVWASVVHGGVPAAELGEGLLAHLACAATGTAIGVPCSRLVVPRIGYTVATALAALAAVLLLRWIPLVNPLLRALSDTERTGTGPMLLGVVASLVALGAATTATALLRRD